MKPTPKIDWSKFNDWLKSQPEGRSFVYVDSRECMVCAFLAECYGIDASVGPMTWRSNAFDSLRSDIPFDVAHAISNAQDKGLVTIGAVKKLLGV